MARCASCGKSAGFLGTLCSECRAEQQRREHEEQRRRDAEADRKRLLARAVSAERMRREEEKVWAVAAERAELLRKRAENGNRVFLYESLYIPVDSKIDDQQMCNTFDIDALRELGLLGWEILQVVPRTIGMSLINKNLVGGLSTGVDAYAGGIGGVVVGVHVILRREVEPHHDAPGSWAVVGFARSHPDISFPEP